jgi:hypothetical protein
MVLPTLGFEIASVYFPSTTCFFTTSRFPARTAWRNSFGARSPPPIPNQRDANAFAFSFSTQQRNPHTSWEEERLFHPPALPARPLQHHAVPAPL